LNRQGNSSRLHKNQYQQLQYFLEQNNIFQQHNFNIQLILLELKLLLLIYKYLVGKEYLQLIQLSNMNQSGKVHKSQIVKEDCLQLHSLCKRNQQRKDQWELRDLQLHNTFLLGKLYNHLQLSYWFNHCMFQLGME
jgi:hypothetical protein